MILAAVVCAALLSGQIVADTIMIYGSNWGWADGYHYDNPSSSGWWGTQMLTGYDYNYNAGTEATSHVKFSLSALDALGAITINSATFGMRTYNASTTWSTGQQYSTDGVYITSDAWTNITPATRPALGAQVGTLVGATPWPYDAILTTTSVDLTSYVVAELAGDKTVSLGLKQLNALDTQSWHSYVGALDRIQLEVNYTAVPEPATLVILGLGGLLLRKLRK